jgi:hypothetical protein
MAARTTSRRRRTSRTPTACAKTAVPVRPAASDAEFRRCAAQDPPARTASEAPDDGGPPATAAPTPETFLPAGRQPAPPVVAPRPCPRAEAKRSVAPPAAPDHRGALSSRPAVERAPSPSSTSSCLVRRGPRRACTAPSPSTRRSAGRASAAAACGATTTAPPAVADALRLSRAMTYKAACAGLPLGGGKGVIMLRDGAPQGRAPARRPARLRRDRRRRARRVHHAEGRRHVLARHDRDRRDGRSTSAGSRSRAAARATRRPTRRSACRRPCSRAASARSATRR